MEPSISKFDVIYAQENGWRHWSTLRKEHGAPDEWPYGLNQLADHARITNPVDLPRLSKTETLLTAALPRRTDKNRRASVGISWDERSAFRMSRRGRVDLMLSGVIWASDDYAAGRNRIRTTATRQMLRKLDGLWCLSAAQVGPTASWLGVEPSRVEYIPFGIDSNFWAYHPPASGRPLIVSVGNDRDRDPQTLFESLDMIIREMPEARAMVQTDSPQTAPPGVTKFDRVSHRELHALYRESSLVMVATRSNLHASGMTVALEAMSTGRPVVATATPGMDLYVPAGVAGALAPVQDSGSIAAAAIKILTTPSLAADMGINGRRLVEETFNSRAMASRISRFAARRLIAHDAS